MPKFSVIVPVYNSELYISACIESIISQTNRDFELLLIDDGSIDDSGLICNKYAQDDRRILVYRKDNGGVSSARNLGLSEAHGDWICFIDSDDVIGPTYLDDFMIGRNAADLYTQGYIIESSEGQNKVLLDISDNTQQAALLCLMEGNNILNSPCYKVYNRSVIIDNNLQFDESLPYGEDHIFTLKYILHISSIYYSPYASYIYQRINGGSLTRRVVKPSILIDYLYKFASLWQAVCDKWGIGHKQCQQLLNSRLHQVILLTTKNSLEVDCDFSCIIEQEKYLIRQYMKSYSNFSNAQKVFITCIKYFPCAILKVLFRTYKALHLSKYIKIGF